jgi:hypothetical protein
MEATLLLAYFPYFEKRKRERMKSPCCLCVCMCIPHINFCMAEPNIMKLGMNIVALSPSQRLNLYITSTSNTNIAASQISICTY